MKPPPKLPAKKPHDTRVEFRLPGDLASWAKEYAEDNNYTMTSLIIFLLTDLKNSVKRHR